MLISICLMHAVAMPVFTFMRAVFQFHSRTVTVSAESANGSTPGVRVTWRTTLPPECMTFVTVEFRTSRHGLVVANYTTTNTSQTKVIQTGLQCGTNYYTRVVVTGEITPPSGTQRLSPTHLDVQVHVGGNETVCMGLNHSNLMVVMPLTQIHQSQLE